VVQAYEHFDTEVVAVRPVGASLVRVTFGGLPHLTSDGPDQRVKVFLPTPGAPARAVPRGADWYQRYRLLPEHARPVMRTYTLRAVRDGQADIDFVRHGDTGPASRWATTAAPGDEVVIWGPDARFTGERGGADYAPGDARWQLLVGDETALPALSGIVAGLAGDAVARVVVEVPDAADRVDFGAGEGVGVEWVVRGADPHGVGLVKAVCAQAPPEGPGYAWVAGEASAVREVRRHLVRGCGMDKARVYFCGYWRLGEAEGAQR
jgi:NADPH-dependent ferric siderophore reductase